METILPKSIRDNLDKKNLAFLHLLQRGNVNFIPIDDMEEYRSDVDNVMEDVVLELSNNDQLDFKRTFIRCYIIYKGI